MELTKVTTPAVEEIVKYTLVESCTLTDKIKLELDNETLDVVVPEGKTWNVRVKISVSEE